MLGLRAVAACVVALTGARLAACGEDKPDDGGPPSGSRTVTIYSSLPLHGPDRESSQDMVNAIKLALEEAGGKAGVLSVTYVSLDSSTREEGGLDERSRARQRAPGGARHQHDRLYRRARLRRDRAVAAADQRGQPAAGQPDERLRRPDARRRRAHGRARALLPVGQAHVCRHRPARPRAGVGARRLHARGGRQQARAARRSRARRRRHRRPGHGGGQGAGHRGRRQGPHRRDEGRPRRPCRRHRRDRRRRLPVRRCERDGRRAASSTRSRSVTTRMLLFAPSTVADTGLPADDRPARRAAPARHDAVRCRRACCRPPRATLRTSFRTTFGREPAPEALPSYEATRAILAAIAGCRREGQRPQRRDPRLLRHEGPQIGTRDVLDRRPRATRARAASRATGCADRASNSTRCSRFGPDRCCMPATSLHSRWRNRCTIAALCLSCPIEEGTSCA